MPDPLVRSDPPKAGKTLLDFEADAAIQGLLAILLALAGGHRLSLDGFVHKPFDISELVDSLEDVGAR